MKRLLTILGFLFFGLTIKNASACSCVGQSTVKGEYKNADIVVSGHVISTREEYFQDSASVKEMIALGIPADKLDKRLSGNYFRKILVKVETIFKGDSTNDTLIIYTGLGGGDCGYNFEAGQNYVVYGYVKSYLGSSRKDQNLPGGQNVFWTNACTRTQKYNSSEIKELKQIKK